jgi:hypothetical protein
MFSFRTRKRNRRFAVSFRCFDTGLRQRISMASLITELVHISLFQSVQHGSMLVAAVALYALLSAAD